MTDPRTDLVRDLGVEAMKAAPPSIVTLYALLTNTIPLLVGVATLVYLGIQMWFLLRKAHWQAVDRRAAQLAGRPAPDLNDGAS